MAWDCHIYLHWVVPGGSLVGSPMPVPWSDTLRMLLAIYYQLDAQKLRTIDLIRRVDTSGDGEVSRTELRKGASAWQVKETTRWSGEPERWTLRLMGIWDGCSFLSGCAWESTH